MTQPAPKGCTARVRRAAAMESCNTKLRLVKDRGYVCENQANHLNPMISGFCDSGWHEGHKIDKPTCKFWLTCPCDCHTQLSRMAALTSSERSLVDNSFWQPEKVNLAGLLTESRTAVALAKPDARVVASEAPGIVPDRIERDFAPTESGRAGRGQLESWVHKGIEAWLANREGNCTPPILSEIIRVQQELAKAPSTGAIDAVFRRWQSIGYAIIGSKPTRFVSFTPIGLRDGLDALKAKAKRG